MRLQSERKNFRTGVPITTGSEARRLITLICAGRNRSDMIRRELPRTEDAGRVFQTVPPNWRRGLSFSWALSCHRHCCPERTHNLSRLRQPKLLFCVYGDGPDETEQLAGK